MALVVFVVGAAVPTSPEQALARYAAQCLDAHGHTTFIAAASVPAADAVIPVTRTEGGFRVGNLGIAAPDLQVHGCGATLSADADDALRRELAVSVDDTLISADEALDLYDAGAVILDVRSNGPHDQVLPGAVQVEKDRVTALSLPHGVPIVVFCNGERGSTPVVRALRESGHGDVRHIRGGYHALVRRAYAHLG